MRVADLLLSRGASGFNFVVAASSGLRHIYTVFVAIDWGRSSQLLAMARRRGTTLGAMNNSISGSTSDQPWDGSEELLQRQNVYLGRVLNLVVDTVAPPSGKETLREVVQHRGSVVLVPVDGDALILVRQYRYAVGRHLLELPAGTLEPGEDPVATAGRELAEETGHRAGRLTKLGTLFPTPGYATEEMHIFLAEHLEPAQAQPDEDESLEVVRMPLLEAVQWAEICRFEDLKTVAGILLLDRRLRASGRG